MCKNKFLNILLIVWKLNFSNSSHINRYDRIIFFVEKTTYDGHGHGLGTEIKNSGILTRNLLKILEPEPYQNLFLIFLGI